MVNKMNKLYYLKKYYRELLESIARYNDLIQCELKSLDILINKQGVFNPDYKHISLIQYKIERDSTIDSILEITQTYYDIRKAKQEKAEQINKRIKQYELYMKQRGMI